MQKSDIKQYSTIILPLSGGIFFTKKHINLAKPENGHHFPIWLYGQDQTLK